MKASEIRIDDWQRILFGNVSPLFLLEVFFRALFVYIILLFVIRLLGKRMSGQLTLTEMSIMLTLGAIVSVSMQTPNTGVLQGIVILIVALVIYRTINYTGFLSYKVETAIFGTPATLVKDGVLQLGTMTDVRISHQQLFSELRSKDIFQLGKVKRVYLEPGGSFSIILARPGKPGLPIYPPDDPAMLDHQGQGSVIVCSYCGAFYTPDHQGPCEHCHFEKYIQAID